MDLSVTNGSDNINSLKQKTKHKRSRRGCLTCRRRKKRCDEGKPTCQTCKRLDLECKYPLESFYDSDSKHGSPNNNTAASWAEHPQMTHSEVFQTIHNYSDHEHIVHNDMASEVHFPLHFSRLATEIEFIGHRGLIDPSSVDYAGNKHIQNSLWNQHMDPQVNGSFLTPLLYSRDNALESSAHMIPPHSAHSLSPPSLNHTPPAKYDSPIYNGSHLTVGDELPNPFASAAHSGCAHPPFAHAGPTTEQFFAVYPDLDAKLVMLFVYFRDKQSLLMSVSPLNYFRSVFLAFSLRYSAILYGILAWAAWHKGDEEELAKILFQKGSYILRQETINSRSKEEILAALLVLASAKICSGDTSDWRPYLLLAGETIHLHGGLTSFMESESVRWLLKNFAYHEILTSSSLSQPKVFTASDFELIFSQPSSVSFPDTLCACCEPIFIILEKINELMRSVRILLSAEETGDLADKDLEDVYNITHVLEQRIWSLKPACQVLQNLHDDELKLQCTLFEVYKYAAVLHMYQSVLRINATAITMRIIAQRLRSSINSLFGTMVEGILIFPLFILGISSPTPQDRGNVIEGFTGMEQRLSARNVGQAKALVHRVWDHDENGEHFVDWNELLDRDGLHFCFC